MKKCERGFTLMEVVISMAILAFVVMGSFRILGVAHQMSQEARYRLVAANTARSVLETIKDTPLALVNNINTANFVPNELPAAAVAIITNPANTTGQTLATITVRITWSNPRNLPGVLEITTMRSSF